MEQYMYLAQEAYFECALLEFSIVKPFRRKDCSIVKPFQRKERINDYQIENAFGTENVYSEVQAFRLGSDTGKKVFMGWNMVLGY